MEGSCPIACQVGVMATQDSDHLTVLSGRVLEMQIPTEKFSESNA